MSDNNQNVENTLTAYLGPEFQTKLMWQLLVEPEFAEKTIPDLAVEYFDDPYLKRLYIIIQEYFKEYEKVPNLQNQSIFQAINTFKTPNNIIEEEALKAVIDRIVLWNQHIINKELLYDGDAVRKKATDFIKQQEYRKTGEFIIMSTKNGEIRKKTTISQIEEKFQKIQRIGDEEDNGVSVFDNVKDALRKEFREPIATGVAVIDTLTGGGLGKGEIGVILTPSGVGKTTLLTKIANTAHDLGKNVCQIIFEDTEQQIQRKHYTIWSGVPLSQVSEKNDIVAEAVLKKSLEMQGKCMLTIKRFSQENTTMMDIRNWMIRYQKKEGIKFDILILDYLDCLESHKKTADRNEAELVIIKSFEALAADFNIPAWTAIQTNRSGFNAEYVEAYQSGGSIKRIQKAHFFMSVAKTPEQKEANLANIRIIKARFAADGQTFNDCTFDNDKVQIIIQDKRYPVQTKQKHHDSEDIDKLEVKSGEFKMHAAISQHDEGSLISRINDVGINDQISSNQFEKKEEILQQFEAENKNDDTLLVMDDAVNDGVSEGVNEGISEGATDGATDGASEGATWGVITGGVNGDINDGVKKENEIFFWDGTSGTTANEVINQPEVKLEDVKPVEKAEQIMQNVVESHQPIIEKLKNYEKNPIRSRQEIEALFEDPDSTTNEHSSIFEAIRKIEKHQHVIKKE